jgi:hypothetical protein
MIKLLFFGIVLIFLLIIQKETNQMDLDGIIQTLTRQAARWSTAAKQDKNPMVAVLHANYGAGYLWALKDIATSEQIKNAAGIDILVFEKEITTVQDAATKKMIEVCPEFGPEKDYLTTIGGN